MEIEKKFTIRRLPEELERYPCICMEQGYLCTRPVVRIRKANDEYILTYKSKTPINEEQYGTKISNEVELPLTKEAFEHLKNKIDGRMIEKERYLIPLQEGQKIELDIFHGYLEGLVFAEVEFQSIEEAEAFLPPDWFLEDVSLDKRYNNSYLSKIECWE